MSGSFKERAEIDLAELFKLGGLHVTQAELASWFGVSQKLIEKRMAQSDHFYDYDGKKLTFKEVFEAGRAKGNVSLRRRQMEVAMSDRHNPTAMLIWLGKQLLGQRDGLDLSAPDGNPLFPVEVVRAWVMNGNK